MSNVSNMINIEMSKSNGSAKVYNSTFISPYLNSVDEWIKWLSYDPSEYEKKKLVLFCKYRDGLCNEQEYMIVVDKYMRSSIVKLMKRKLPKEGVIFCDNVIRLLNRQSDEKVKEYIDIYKDSYNELSLTDAYIYHYACLIAYQRDINKLNEEIGNQVDVNHAMEDRSLILARDKNL